MLPENNTVRNEISRTEQSPLHTARTGGRDIKKSIAFDGADGVVVQDPQKC